MVVTHAEQQSGEQFSGRWWHAWRWLGKGLLLGLAWACGAAAGEAGEAQRAVGWIVHVDAPAAAGGVQVQVLPRPVFAVPAEKSGAGRAGVAAQRSRSEQAALAAQPGVRLVEPDLLGEFAAVELVPLPVAVAPDDPAYARQGWLRLAGAGELWQFGQGAGVTVAVIDSGVDLSHPDLAPNLLPGYDLADDDADPQDVLGHGTAVAGLVGAVCGNGRDGCGMAPQVRLVPFKVSRSSGEGARQPLASAVAAAVRRASGMGVQVINLSLSFGSPVQLLTAAIEEAQARGILVVAAAGNGLAGPVAYPANLPGVIAVANTTPEGYLHLTSCFGPEVTLAAVGTYPQTTLLGGQFGSPGVGTSFAAPQVTGALAALRSANPAWSKALLVQALQASSKPVPGQRFGSLQAGAAARWLMPALAFSVVDPAGQRLGSGAGQGSAGSGDSGEWVQVAYRLPATEVPLDVYVSVETPLGRFGLAADGSWWTAASESPRPWRQGYVGAGGVGRVGEEGVLFGAAGQFPPIALTELPRGSYVWQLSLRQAGSQQPLGPELRQPTRLY